MVLRQCITFQVIWKSNVKVRSKRLMTRKWFILWAYEVFKWFLMILISIVWIFMKHRVPTSKNIQGVRKIALEAFMCVLMGLACLDILHVIFFAENCMDGLKIVNLCIFFINVPVKLTKGHVKGRIRRTQGLSRHCLGRINRLNQRHPICWQTARK